MSKNEVSVTYVSRKINKIRWRPPRIGNFQNDPYVMFVTGSWDDEKNYIALWNIFHTTPLDESNGDEANNGEPNLLSEYHHRGDVTDLQFLSSDCLSSASSFGFVELLKLTKEEIKSTQTWEGIHHFKGKKAACTGLASKSEEIISVGEDGRIVCLNINRNAPILSKDCESCSLTCVSYVRSQEIVVGNSRGQVKMWDLKSKSDSPSKTFSMSGFQAPIMCLNQHPSQSHVIATGLQDGKLSIWDLRQEFHPVAVLNGHEGSISDVKFHPGNPEILFTSSFDGSVWQWDSSSIKGAPMATSAAKSGGNILSGLDPPVKQLSGISNPWLNCDATKHRLDIFSLLPTLYNPVNCLDIKDSILVCGCDNETVYVVSDIKT